MKNYIILFITSIIFFSCQTEPVDVEIPQSPERLVVATQYTDNGVLVLGLSRTFNVLKDVKIEATDSSLTIPEELLIAGAEVFIHFNNQQIRLEQLQNGVYYTDQLPELMNEDYFLEIHTTDKNQSISAKTRMQPQAKFDTVTLNKNTGASNQYRLHYSFSDSSEFSQKQYYVVSYVAKSKHNQSSQSGNYLERIAQSILQPNSNFELYSSDQFINGKISATKLLNADIRDTMVVTIANIHQDYYEFLKTFKKAKKLVNQLKGEPINLPSNIVNGYGFFSLAPPDIKLISTAQ